MKIEYMLLDLETRSSVDITKSGVYKYAESQDFEILLFGVSVNGGEVAVYDLASGDKVPVEIIKALSDDCVTKYTFNASFERVTLSVWLRRNYPQYFVSYSDEADFDHQYLSPNSWKCTLVWAAYNGLPLSLDKVGAVLGFEEQKLKEGKELIRYFCMPSKSAEREWNLPEHAPEKWELFKKYNQRDVEVEMQIQERLKNFPVPDFVWDEYHQDQTINDRGIMIDRELVEQAIRFDEISKNELFEKMKKFTNLENPNSVSQLKDYLSSNGINTETLGKKDVVSLIPNVSADIAEVLELRLQLAKSSVKKYRAMQNAVCDDGRARGLFLFYGANRTGRFSSKIVQLQNLARNSMSDLDQARALVRSGDYESVSMLYSDVPDTLSQLVRTAFIPPKGKLFYVADFSAIEARVIAWLAGEKWRTELFKNGGDIYCMSASQMFKVPVEKHGINGHLRQKGKIAELACIAEGQLVLTDRGLVPIQEVSLDDKLWDGESWVEHKGVIYKGEKEVIEYEGLTATPDHLVWIEGKSEPVYFGYAATSGAHLVQTGNGRHPIRLGKNHFSGKTVGCSQKKLFCSYAMSRLWSSTVEKTKRFTIRTFQRMSTVFNTETDSQMVRAQTNESKATMRKSKSRSLQRLWRKRHSVQVSKRYRGWKMDHRKPGASRQTIRDRSNKQQWELCSRKYSFCNKIGKLWKQKKYSIISFRAGILAIFSKAGNRKTLSRENKGADNSRCGERCKAAQRKLEANKRTTRLYDIRNAGQHHRFTVSNSLVHNCGYGGGTGALKNMGALEMGLKEEELQPLVNAWRNANPNIVKFWWAVDNAVMEAVGKRTTTKTHGLTFSFKSGMMFITLPSGRKLAYVKPRIGINRFGGESATYEGIGATKKWERLESYGPKFVENIIQAIARDILCYAMKTLKHCSIVMHIHDEVVIEADPSMSLDDICEQMGQTPAWAEGLILQAAGYTSAYYKKD